MARTGSASNASPVSTSVSVSPAAIVPAVETEPCGTGAHVCCKARKWPWQAHGHATNAREQQRARPRPVGHPRRTILASMPPCRAHCLGGAQRAKHSPAESTRRPPSCPSPRMRHSGCCLPMRRPAREWDGVSEQGQRQKGGAVTRAWWIPLRAVRCQHLLPASSAGGARAGHKEGGAVAAASAGGERGRGRGARVPRARPHLPITNLIEVVLEPLRPLLSQSSSLLSGCS